MFSTPTSGVGLFSLVFGLVCAHCCCRNTAHTPRSRNKLMDLEMDWQTISPPHTHCSTHRKHHPQSGRANDYWDTHLFQGNRRWDWNADACWPGRGCVSAVKAELGGGGFAFKTSFFMKICSNLWCFQWVFFFKTRIIDYSSVRSSLEDLRRHHCHWESRSTDQRLLGLMILILIFFLFSYCAKARCRAQLLPVPWGHW